MSLADWGNVAQIVQGAVVAPAAIIALVQLRASLHAQDFEALLRLQTEIREAWEKLLDPSTSEDMRSFYFAEVLVLYETTCHAFNRGILGKKVEEHLCSHIVEVMHRLATNSATLEQIKGLRSGKDTHREIKEFIDKHSDKFEEHKEFLSKL